MEKRASMVGTFIGALAFIGFGAHILHKNIRLSRRGECVSGVVARLNTTAGHEGPGTTTVVAFQTLDGQDIRAGVGGGSGIPTQLGMQVPIIYDPRHPKTARINTRGGRMNSIILSFSLIVVGMAIAGYGLYTAVK